MDDTFLLRPWLGHSKAGSIVISAPHALAGYGSWIYFHESTHDGLIKHTPFGHLQLLLWSLTQESFPQGELQSHAQRLLDLTVAASWTTQEAAATYVAATVEEESPDLPEQYHAAAQLFGWLDDYAPAPREVIAGSAAILATYALETPLLDDWFDNDLLTPENLEAHLADSRNRPDDRLPLVIDAAREMGPYLTVALTSEPVDLLGARLRAADMPISAVASVEEYHALARRFTNELRHRFSLSPFELATLDRYDEAPDLAYPVQTRSEFSTVVDATSGRQYAVIPSEDWASVIRSSELLVVQANATDDPIPGRQAFAGAVDMVPPNGTLVRSYSEELTATFSPPIDELLDLLAIAPEDVSVCARSLSYDFGVGGFSPALLADRRHIVLIGSPPFQLFLELRIARSFAGETQVISSVVRHEPDSDLAYLLFRPRSKPSPIGVLPAVTATLGEIVRMFDASTTLSVRAAPLPELVDATGLSNLNRLLTWFAGRVPRIFDEYGVGFGPGPAA